MKRTISIIAVLLLAVPAAASSSTAEPPVVDAEGIELIQQFEYGDLSAWDDDPSSTDPFFDSGTDLAFEGDFVYAAEQDDSGRSAGGVHIIDVSDPDNPEQVGFVNCPGYQNDVAVVEPGIIALAYHSRTHGVEGSICDPDDPQDQGAVAGGVVLFNVEDPAQPERLGTSTPLPGGTHTLTVSPDGNHIYASPGGIANGAGVQQILDITNREGPFGQYTFQPNRTGCHDFDFFTSVDEREMGVCVGLTESQIWDLTDPTAPVIVSRIHNPLIQFHHSGIVTDDGRYLVIGDEAIGANDCIGAPTGAMFAYDLSIPEVPTPRGYFGIDRTHGDAVANTEGRVNWCTAHIYNFIPGTYTMVASWYSGGANIIDWGDDFLSPREVAHYRTDGAYPEREVTNYWSAYWHNGQIYANDRVRGLDVLRWDALGPDDVGDPEWVKAAVASAPSTTKGWRSGRFFNTPTPAQQLWLAQRPAASLGQLSPYACRLTLLN